jgi:hypothetical protein
MEQMQAKKLFGYLMMEATYWGRLDDKVKHTTQATYMLTQVFVQPEKFVTVPNPDPNLPNPTKISVSPLNVQVNIITRGKHNCADEECPAN